MAKNECEKTVWINDTVELLLQVTSESKASKLHDEVYWESCQLKFADILVIQVFWLNIPQFSEKSETGGLSIAFVVFIITPCVTVH